jgi:ATP-dependent Clp protease ATP-binding subunit ClpB
LHEPHRVLGESAKKRQEEVRKRLLDALKQTFRPEFLNRVDDIIVFNPWASCA